MSKPTHEELQEAIHTAILMREQGLDTHHVAKALLNCRYLHTYLQQVMQAAERYLNSGLGEREHTQLVLAIQKARKAEDYSAKIEHDELGLG